MADGSQRARGRQSHSEAASWFFENAQGLFGVLDAEGRLTSVNPAWERVTGWTPQELAQHGMLHFVHEDSREAVRGMARDVALHGSTQTVLHFATKAGGWVWLE